MGNWATTFSITQFTGEFTCCFSFSPTCHNP